MKIRKLSMQYLSVILGLSLIFTACKKNDPDPITIVSIKTDGNIILDGITSASNVPLVAKVVLTLSKAVDPTTVNSTNITLTTGGTATAFTTALDGTGMIVTLTPSASLSPGTTYVVTATPNLRATDGAGSAGGSISFKTFGKALVTPPKAANQVAYWLFDGNTKAFVGSPTYDSFFAKNTFGADRATFAGNAALFNGTDDIIELSNGNQLISASMTISFWMKLDDSKTEGDFVMGVGNTGGFFIEVSGGDVGQGANAIKLFSRYGKPGGTSINNDFYINADGQNSANGGWAAIEFEKDLTAAGGLKSLLANKWAHLVFTFDATSKKRSFYVNGELIETDNLTLAGADLADVTGMSFNSATQPVGEVIGNKLALGFFCDRATTNWSTEPWGGYTFAGANHFKGGLDDVRIFNASLTAADVTTLYNAEKP